MSGVKISEVAIEWWPIEAITPYELNVKKHEKDQVARIVAAIQKSGRFDVPIVVDKNGVIIKGHGRRLAALELGLKKVPVICHRDISDEQARQMRLADNRVAISDIDPELLKVELSTLDLDCLVGIFDTKELDFLNADLGSIDESVFVEDMGAILADQKADLEQRTERAKTEKVAVHKALGFTHLPADGLIHVTRLMARIEAETGLEGAEAFVRFAEQETAK